MTSDQGRTGPDMPDEQLLLERNRLLYGPIPRSVLATVVLGALLGAVVSRTAGFERVALWFGLLVGVGIVRFALYRAYRTESDDPARARHHHARLVAGAVAAGGVWGLGALVLFPPDLVGRVFMAFVYAGVSAGSVATLAPSRSALAGFLSLTLGPLIARLLLVGDATLGMMGGMTVLFLAFLIASGRRIASMLDENARLRFGERRREVSLVRQRDLLEQVGRMAAVGGWTFDVEAAELRWSRQVYRIYGLAPDQRPTLEQALQPYRDAGSLATIEHAMAGAVDDGVPYDVEVPFTSLDGRRLWVRARGEREVRDGRTILTGAFQDVTERRLAEEALRTNLRALRRLYAITSDATADLAEKIDAILDLGLEVLGLDLGIVSRIDGDRYEVRRVRGSVDLPPIGTVFSVGETYCAHTLAADGPVSFHHAGESAIRDHPCYRGFGLESYIGSPLLVDGERYGTLNFSAPDPRAAPFTDADRALIQTLAEWIGFELSRDRVLRQLADSEERVRLLLESVGEGVYGLDAEGRATFVNPAAASILGYDPDDMLGRAMHDLVHPTHPDGSAYPVEACPIHGTLSEGVAHQAEETFWRSDGTAVSTEVTSTPVWKDGSLVGTVVSFRDVTVRKRFERELTSTLAMQRAILDSANYSIVATDVDGAVQTFSQGAERMLGYAAADVLGASPVVFHLPEELAERAAHMSRELGREVAPGFETLVAGADRPDGGVEGEWTYLRADGSRFPVLLSVTAVRSGGDLLGYLFVGADLTERKRVERLKNEFVSTVSHELRTPLTSIRGSLGLVAGGAAGELPDRARDLVGIAARNSERLILLINDILDMEKIESGRLEFSLRRQRLVPLLEQAVEANVAFAREHGVRIALDTAGRDPWVDVDEFRLNQVLTNLLSNACKFSPEGDTVSVVLDADSSDDRVRVSVVDHGPGIPEEFRPRIFEKFSQADGSDRRVKGGTGLGLSISRALVEQMGGSIGFDSDEGRGSTFWVELPHQARSESRETEPADGPTDAARGAGATVIVCASDVAAGRAMADALRAEGYDARTVPEPEGVREAVLGGATPGAVLLDLTFPDGAGIELVRWLRRRPETARTPVVGVSARIEDDALAINGDITLVDLLPKPASRDAVLGAFEHALRSSSPGGASVLHVEDDDDLRRTVAEIGQGIAEFRSAHTLAEARAALLDGEYDLVLLDIGLPDGSGWDLLPSIQRLDRRPPVVVFSATPVGAQDAQRVEAALLKSRAAESVVLATLRGLLTRHDAAPPSGVS